jgi:exodeoxyribonuclease V gamma subunit
MEGDASDEETFAADALHRWALLDDVLRATRAQVEGGASALASPPGSASEAGAVAALVEREVARLRRAGRLPLAQPGRAAESVLVQTLVPMAARWQAALAEHPEACAKQPLRFEPPADAGLVLDDWLVGLRRGHEGARPVWIELQASEVAKARERGEPTLREDKLLVAWVRCLASAACGCPADGLLIGPGAFVQVSPPAREEAQAVLGRLLQACAAGLEGDEPLPTAVRTGLAYLRDAGKAKSVYEGDDAGKMRGEGEEACLARLFPDFGALRSRPGFDAVTRQLYEPFIGWLAAHVHAQVLPGPDLGDEAERDGGDDA